MNVTKVQQRPEPVAASPRKLTLADIRGGPIEAPHRVLVYGVEGSGKSTFAASAPAPLFLGMEGGTIRLDVQRLPEPRTWADVLEAVAFVRNEDHPFKTLVVDPLNWIEPMCWHAVTGGKPIDAKPFDYGKGYVAALALWRTLLEQLERVWIERKIHVVLVAHAEIKRFENPMGEAWNHYVPAMNEKASGLFKRWVDHVIFVAPEQVARKGEDGRVVGKGTGIRMAYAAPCPAFDAKGRGIAPETVLPAVDGWGVIFGKGAVK